MKSKVRRIFVLKKEGYDIEAKGLLKDLKINLGISGLDSLRIINRYDVSGITDEEYLSSRCVIFSEPPVDSVFDEEIPFESDERVFAIEYLPGQYDQRADSAAQCIQMITLGEKPRCKVAKLIALKGQVNDEEFNKIKEYCINPVESHEALMDKPLNLDVEAVQPPDVKVIEDFISMDEASLGELLKVLGLAMSDEDLKFCKDYFKNTEKRNPTLTEIRLIDTYWSDHCRHTTFLTSIEKVEIENSSYSNLIKSVYDSYLKSRDFVYEGKNKEICLMDLATIAMKELKKKGLLKDLDISDEINACSIVVNAKINGEDEEWLVMFKNETHNHPTEIEPFGGAATCLGGAIRDPLSGRSYVYQAMRVTGSGDPRTKVKDTIPGKLPQRKITTGAAAGYSSYGNQIGLATGQVAEIYDEGYVAKRMEIGAVIGAAPKKNIVREKPDDGDIIILLGGRTGRDGCGGATGSSKEHTEESLLTCGAEVQKGNPPTERKIQRLFRNEKVSRMIKKCNDFGAGGVSVAIGELADGLVIDLDAVPKKYDGLDGTELAISESQERMAVVVKKEDVEAFITAAGEENLEASVVAVVKKERRLKMLWRGNTIVDISRDFLDTNGVRQLTDARISAVDKSTSYFDAVPRVLKQQNSDLLQAWIDNLQDLNICSQKGLVERFDSTIGAGSILMPFGGIYQLTPAEGMAAKLPVLQGDTDTGTLMTYGFNPEIAKWSPFHGALYSIIEAVAKITALGGDYKKVRLTLQEYFEKLGRDSSKWGKPLSALLGAYYAQIKLGLPAIGGKDSMSGTFKDLTVPPTLVAFAVAPTEADKVLSSEFKAAGNKVVLLKLDRDDDDLPDFGQLEKNFSRIFKLSSEKKLLSARTVRSGGVAEAISKMCFGNKIGFAFSAEMLVRDLFRPMYGALVLETDKNENVEDLFKGLKFSVLGSTCEDCSIKVNSIKISLEQILQKWQEPLEKVFPTTLGENRSTPEKISKDNEIPETISYKQESSKINGAAIKRLSKYNLHYNCATPSANLAKDSHKSGSNILSLTKSPAPRVFIPVFPGTNCEYDSARAFEKAGAVVDTIIVRNLTPADIMASIKRMKDAISESQIVMFPGGFSAGDEPEGSGKFIAAAFRNPYIKEAMMDLIKNRDGLVLGICNGFQALIKLGLLPYGEIQDMQEDSPTLTFNTIGRHVSCMVSTRISSNISPWFNNVEVGDIHSIAVSHGEGRFVCSHLDYENMVINGQIATQYVDANGIATYDNSFNPNGSMYAVEGITSPDGRVLGKMGHSERKGVNIAMNVPGLKDQFLFEAGVKYFK